MRVRWHEASKHCAISPRICTSNEADIEKLRAHPTECAFTTLSQIAIARVARPGLPIAYTEEGHPHVAQTWGSVHDILSLRFHAFELRPLIVLVDELGIRVMLVSSLLHRAVLYAWQHMPKRTTRSTHADTLPYEKATRTQREQVHRELRKLERHRPTRKSGFFCCVVRLIEVTRSRSRSPRRESRRERASTSPRTTPASSSNSTTP